MAILFSSNSIGLVQPIIATDRTFGTLPQNWGLIANENFIKIDSHDHAESGTRIPSTNLINSADVNCGVGIFGLQYAALTSLASDPGQNLSLFVKSNELYFKDGAGNVIQLTNVGNVPVIIGNGFFGDYGPVKAQAVYSGSQGLFTFNTALGVVLANVTCNSAIFGSTIDSDQTSYQSSVTFATKPPTITQTKITINDDIKATNKTIIVDANGVNYTEQPIIGDGSPYMPSGAKVKLISDSAYTLNLNSRDMEAFNNDISSTNISQHLGIHSSEENASTNVTSRLQLSHAFTRVTIPRMYFPPRFSITIPVTITNPNPNDCIADDFLIVGQKCGIVALTPATIYKGSPFLLFQTQTFDLNVVGKRWISATLNCIVTNDSPHNQNIDPLLYAFYFHLTVCGRLNNNVDYFGDYTL